MQMKNVSELRMIRDVVESDLPFIYSTWLKSFYHGGEFYDLNRSEFLDSHRKVIDKILGKQKSKIKVNVCCLKEDPEIILGYSVVQKKHILHYVFVKELWRKQGIAKELIPSTIDIVTHLTKLGKKLKPENWEYSLVFLMNG